MKRIISIGLTVLLLGFLLAACGGKASGETQMPVRETEAVADMDTAPAAAPSEEARKDEVPVTTVPQTEPTQDASQAVTAPSSSSPEPTQTNDEPTETESASTEAPDQQEDELPMIPVG